MALGRSFSFFEPRFPHLGNGDDCRDHSEGCAEAQGGLDCLKHLALALGWVGEQGADGTVLAPGPENTSWFGERNLVHMVGTGPKGYKRR